MDARNAQLFVCPAPIENEARRAAPRPILVWVVLHPKAAATTDRERAFFFGGEGKVRKERHGPPPYKATNTQGRGRPRKDRERTEEKKMLSITSVDVVTSSPRRRGGRRLGSCARAVASFQIENKHVCKYVRTCQSAQRLAVAVDDGPDIDDAKIAQEQVPRPASALRPSGTRRGGRKRGEAGGREGGIWPSSRRHACATAEHTRR